MTTPTAKPEPVNPGSTPTTAAPTPVRAPLTFTYMNHRGVKAQRTVWPDFIWFGSTSYYEGEHWYMHAFDDEKEAYRDFMITRMEF